MNTIKGFTFFKSYYESLKNLKEKDKKEIINAILEYVFDDKIPNFSGTKKVVWTLLEPNLNTSKKRSNPHSGAPHGNSNASREKQSKNNQKTINDLLKDKDKDKDKDSVCVINNTPLEPPHDTNTIFDFALTLDENYEEKSLKSSCKKFFNYYKEKNWEGINNWQDKLEFWLNTDLEKGILKLNQEDVIEYKNGFKYVNGKRML